MMLRQAIALSLKDIKQLEKEYKETIKEFDGDKDTKVLFPIINKESECSDTWEFEK